MKPILQNKTPRLQYHAPVVSAAAKALADENIPVVEYGEQIRWRHGDPIVLSLVEWAVPDTLFSRSNQILSDRGFPPFTTNADTNGQGQRAYNIYNLGSSLSLYLYPLSFLGLSLQDTTEVSSTFDHTIKVLTPGPAGYMISLICQLLGHPVGDSSRSRVTLDLLSFISFYILRDKPLYTKDGKCDDDESEKDFQKRVEDAVQQMKNWNWGDANSSYLSIAESVVRDCRSIAQLSSD